ncbi:hypothetical protein [Microbacterium sp. NC79]|uniref:hypothetical protein n=1 Tax=Microbacterium sp. NC79 TaxID=2851009 RepID=UPI001C2B8398|nr:hypothetical protein [Microbacterium sp. NC79]MBV0894357.1 hypothetical protein [Microbacterium sp. NC79]
MAGFWGKRRRAEQEEQLAADTELSRRAEAAMIAVDERIRTAADEVGFAQAELGAEATKDLRDALTAVRTHMQEAFTLHQLNHDHLPDTPEELRTRNARIVQLCEWADDVLDERTAALADRIDRVRRAPEVLARVHADSAALDNRVPAARDTIVRLAERYNDTAMSKVAAGADEATQLIAFARHSADVSSRRRAAGHNEEANLALETAIEAVRRAATVLDGVEDYELQALRAESTLNDVIADSRNDLIAARDMMSAPAVATAMSALEAALAQLPPAGSKSDPFTSLSQLRDANQALDAAVVKARDRAARPLPAVEAVRHAVDDADRQIAVARSVIAGHRGWIGADARTRLAEAERLRIDIDRLIVPEDTREEALALARRTAQLASEALQLAQRDIDSSRPQQQNTWGGGGRNQGGGMSDMMGGLIGGAILGGILGDIFD